MIKTIVKSLSGSGKETPKQNREDECDIGHVGQIHRYWDSDEDKECSFCKQCATGRSRISHSGIINPEGKSFMNFDDGGNQNKKNMLAAAHKFAKQSCEDDSAGWLLLHGKTGTGKGHIASAIMQYICMHELKPYNSEYGFMYYRFSSIMREVKECFNGGETTEHDWIKRIRGHRFLIMDELADKPMTDWERAFIEDVLDYRYECRKPTVLITNLAPSALFGVLGNRIESRLAHIGKVICFDWGDYRKGEK